MVAVEQPSKKHSRMRIFPLTRLPKLDLDSTSAARRGGEADMDESTTLSSSDRSGGSSAADARPALGTVKSFVELTELKRLLAQLMAAELVRMMVAEGS
jgi:hypothetical protein